MTIFTSGMLQVKPRTALQSGCRGTDRRLCSHFTAGWSSAANISSSISQICVRSRVQRNVTLQASSIDVESRRDAEASEEAQVSSNGSSTGVAVDSLSTYSSTRHSNGSSSCIIQYPFPRLPDNKTLPYLLCLPDLDGVGLTSKKQWPQLASVFDFQVLELRPEDRSTFKELVSFVKAHLATQLQDVPLERPVYILGEGFGALIALAVALESSIVNRLILINPATSYPESALSQVGPILARLPAPLYQLAPFALLPALSNPLGLSANYLPTTLDGGLPTASVVKILQEALPQLQQLASSLPPEALAWRLSVLEDGCNQLDGRVKEIPQRIAVFAGEQDLVLPSAKHGKDELQGMLQRGFVKILPNRGHALLSEANLDLVQLLMEEGFYITTRKFTSAPTPASLKALAGPVEIPAPEEVKRVAADWTGRIRDLSSPVFFSTLADGTIVQGIEGLPLEQRPLLLVGNHQVYAFDMYVLIEELILKAGFMPRGLAHPGLFRDTKGNAGLERATASVLPDVVSNNYRTYGAVPVSGQNFFRLLQRGESVLLYPGGVREGFKRKGEKYRLFWPERSEFVRMAAKFGATIVPMSSIGIEDGLEILYDTDEIKNDLFIGPRFTEQAATVPNARIGMDPEQWDQTFIPPFIFPKVPARLYFLFHKPITLTKEDYADKERCADVYKQVKADVENGISYLLHKREQDPYGSFLQRYLYEHPLNQPPRQAPTFTP